MTARQFKIDHTEAAQEHTCGVIESEDGRAVIRLFYHTTDDLAAEATPDSQDEAPDPEELTGKHTAVFNRVHEETASGGTILLAELKAKVAKHDISPGECHDIVDELVAGGYVTETEDAVYKSSAAAAHA